MTKGQDFFGKDITDVMEQACKAFETAQENLNIEILETGSAGIFGLCRKQAHIRVTRKEEQQAKGSSEAVQKAPGSEKKSAKEKKSEPSQNRKPGRGKGKSKEAAKRHQQEHAPELSQEVSKPAPPANEQPVEKEVDSRQAAEKAEPVEVPIKLSPDCLDDIKATVEQLLAHMQCPSEVKVDFDGNTVTCDITGEYEEDIIGNEGRTLDSLQYLVRKMVIQNLPDKLVLALNVGDFRERRSEELKTKALELAEKVKEDGKTQAIPALNPSERRTVHMVLQEDKGIRSRSVGDGLFKKVLIYKPGKSRRSGAKRKRG